MPFETLKQKLTPKKLPFTKTRFGPNKDGGYILAQDLLLKIECMYSLGVGGECGFDYQVADMGIGVFMYDGSVNGPPYHHNNFFFKKIYISENNFESELKTNGHENNKNMIAQIDIECNEYNFFDKISSETLKKFSQMIVEFHELHFQNELNTAWLDKILEHFYVFHIHGNNIGMDGREGRGYMGTYIDGFPNVMEVTFVRKDLCQENPANQETGAPIIGLDFPNASDKIDYAMDWWINKQ